jgi:GTP-binding protein EngB required for normal cell division
MAVAREFEAPEMIRALPNAYVRIDEFLSDNTDALEILLLGRSGAGKSSFINAMFDKAVATVGDVAASETKKVSSYSMTLRETEIKVYDSPGFERDSGGFRRQKKWLKAIKEECKTIDYIFVCIRLDDQLQKSDEDGLKCLAKGFGSCADFWKKTTIIFTRANSVCRHLEGRNWQDTIRGIARQQMDIITRLLTRCNSRIILNEDQYSVAGSPFKRRTTQENDSSSGSLGGSDNTSATNPMILRREQYDDPQEWVPHLIGSWLISAEGIQKVKLLRTQLTKKEIAAHTTLNGSSAIGIGVGVACCVIGAGASFAGPVGPAIGIPLMTLGATTIAISATTGVSANASVAVKGVRKIRYRREIAAKESQGTSGEGTVHFNPAADIDNYTDATFVYKLET